MNTLDLKILEDGTSTGLSVRNGGFLAEAASICLENCNHSVEVNFPVTGEINIDYNLKRLEVDDLSKNSFNDIVEATQFGAMGIAVAIMQHQTGLKVKRSWKGTGFDYWIGENDIDSLFENKLRLEVSGDLVGTDSEVKSRLKDKLAQTKPSDKTGLAAYAIIVEFSSPKSLTGSR